MCSAKDLKVVLEITNESPGNGAFILYSLQACGTIRELILSGVSCCH